MIDLLVLSASNIFNSYIHYEYRKYLAKKTPPFEFAGLSIDAGKHINCELEIARLYTHSPLSVSVDILHGKHPGPVLLINAAIHGDELNGIEVVRQTIENNGFK